MTHEREGSSRPFVAASALPPSMAEKIKARVALERAKRRFRVRLESKSRFDRPVCYPAARWCLISELRDLFGIDGRAFMLKDDFEARVAQFNAEVEAERARANAPRR